MWHSDSRIEQRIPQITLTQALEHEARRSGVFTFGTFDHFDGFDAVFTQASEYAAKKAFGHRFAGFRYTPNKPFLKGYDSTTVIAHGSLYVAYRGLIDVMRDAHTFNLTFDAFRDAFRAHIQATYPDVDVAIQHRGCYKREVNFIIKVALTSRF